MRSVKRGTKGRQIPAGKGKKPGKVRWRKLPAGMKIVKPKPAKVKPVALELGAKRYWIDPKRKVHRAVAKVQRDAYTFAPDAVIAVALDLAHQRVMVKTVDGALSEGPTGAHFLAELSAITKKYMMIERMNKGWGLGRDCEHPRQFQRVKRYCIGTDKGIECFRNGKFCVKCGKLLSEVADEFKATLGEIAMAHAKFPQVRKT